jgi:hypothetical protein
MAYLVDRELPVDVSTSWLWLGCDLESLIWPRRFFHVVIVVASDVIRSKAMGRR